MAQNQNKQNQNQQKPVVVSHKTEAQQNAESQTEKDLQSVDMQGDKPFSQRYPGDISIGELHQQKLDSLNRLFDQRKKEMGSGFDPVKEQAQLERQFRRVEMADLDLTDFLERKARLAERFETMGLIQSIEAVTALLLATNVPGQTNASKKMAAAVRILKEANGIDENADALKPPSGD